MRVGEILLQRGWVDGAALDRALAEQRHTKKRLCSMLIARGLLEPDHAARALGEQHGCAAVLQKHLEHRDRSLVDVLPAELARPLCALPIGRMGNGELIVCVREPRADVIAAISAATRERLVFAVAPAHQLEMLVEQSYETSASEEFDVDMTTGPIATIPPDDELGLLSSGAFSLVELDDISVAKDFSQTSLDPPRTQSRPVVSPRGATRPVLASLAVASSLETTIEQLVTAAQADDATDAAMKLVETRWASSLLVTIKEGAALGHRGHGAQLSREAVSTIVLPLTSPSLIQAAHASRGVVTGGRAGAIQDRLLRLLGQPDTPQAVPIVVGPRAACVLVVGDPRGDAETAARELEALAIALGEAYTRIVRQTKR